MIVEQGRSPRSLRACRYSELLAVLKVNDGRDQARSCAGRRRKEGAERGGTAEDCESAVRLRLRNLGRTPQESQRRLLLGSIQSVEGYQVSVDAGRAERD